MKSMIFENAKYICVQQRKRIKFCVLHHYTVQKLSLMRNSLWNAYQTPSHRWNTDSMLLIIIFNNSNPCSLITFTAASFPLKECWGSPSVDSPVLSVAQSGPTLCDPMDYSPTGSSVHGILQARMLEWIAMPFSRGSSQPRDRTWVSCIAGRLFTIWVTGKTFASIWGIVGTWLCRHEKVDLCFPLLKISPVLWPGFPLRCFFPTLSLSHHDI